MPIFHTLHPGPLAAAAQGPVRLVALFPDAAPDGDFDDLDSVPVAAVWAAWHEAVARSREILAISDVGHQVQRRGETLTVGWVAMHMIEEYARHNGHADLLREAIDGTTGD